MGSDHLALPTHPILQMGERKFPEEGILKVTHFPLLRIRSLEGWHLPCFIPRSWGGGLSHLYLWAPTLHSKCLAQSPGHT